MKVNRRDSKKILLGCNIYVCIKNDEKYLTKKIEPFSKHWEISLEIKLIMT